MPKSIKKLQPATLAAAEAILPPELVTDPHIKSLPRDIGSVAALPEDEITLVGPGSRVDALSFGRRASSLVPTRVEHPMVEPEESFRAYLDAIPAMVVDGPDLGTIEHTLAGRRPLSVDHRQWQTDFRVSQGARGTCWAFAGAAALEAAYMRQGIRVKLSEHYLFHLSKAHENQRAGPGIHSLIGFQGSSDVVHHLKYWRLPVYDDAPYIDQPQLQKLADDIPQTGGGLANTGPGTLEQDDWFEFDLRNVPLQARWSARYGVATFGQLTNYSLKDLKNVLASGYDVVIDVQGHTMLCYGYVDSDVGGFLLIKNSQRLPGFETMSYFRDPNFTLNTSYAFYITSVRPPETLWAAMWLGRWEMDHNGLRGRLVIRRYLDIRADQGLPPPGAPISLGTWYGVDGRVLPVDGGFVDAGRGLRCTIGGGHFELYLHSRDPYRASGRFLWNNTWFGVVLSRGTCVGAGSGFDRAETIGLWEMIHDGWRGQARIGASPVYRQATDGTERAAWIDPGAIAHQVDLHVDFGGDNRNQHFQLLHHTGEDGMMGGLTQWGGRDWPVEARMSANLYLVFANGGVKWYQHVGRYARTFEWSPEQTVNMWWAGHKSVFGGGDGVIYAIEPNGDLLWYYHEGRNQGQVQWAGSKKVGNGWGSFSRVFAGEGGVIYAVRPNGDLLWYRHLGRLDGTFQWEGPHRVGGGWQTFTALAAGPDGTVYGVLPDGRLLWYRHYGYDHGHWIWHAAEEVGHGWQQYDRLLVAGNGFVYARNRNGELWCWRHHGFQTGAADWTAGAKVGTGWGGPEVRDILLS
jgi:hypothetical protein